MDEPTLLIDSMFVCHRMKHIMNHDKHKHGVIQGFLDHIIELYRKFKTNKFIFCWDSKESIREQVYPQYKKKRTEVVKSEDDLRLDRICNYQFDLIEDVLRRIGFANHYFQEGYESDDLIAETCKSRPYKKFIIVTRDNDLLQCISDNTDMFNPMDKIYWTKRDFMYKYGIAPEQWAEVKAIAGCKSDNVIGINGVAETTALQYLTKSPKLKQSSKRYQYIVSEEGRAIKERNLPLVKLPYDGTKLYKIKDDTFDFEELIEVSLEFELMLDSTSKSNWRYLMEVA